MKHFVTKHPEIESDHSEAGSETESPSDDWQRYYSIHNQPSIPDSPHINRWLDAMKDRPEPKNNREWMDAGMLMVQMLLESQRGKE